MTAGRISVEVTEQTLTEITEALNSIESKLPGLSGLSEAERSSQMRLGDKNLAHVQKALAYADQNPALIPGFLEVSEWHKDVNLVVQLSEVQRQLLQLSRKIEDTAIIAGDEAYAAASAFYKSVIAAEQNGVAGAKAVKDDLATRFATRRNTNAEPESPAPAETVS